MAAALRTRIWLVTAALAVAALGSACTTDDVGTCCVVFDPANEGRIPVAPAPDPTNPNDQQSSVIRQDPAFDCSGLTCTAYQGSKAFCTRQCNEDADCPEGFTCAPVLESDPGPGAAIQKDDKFCVRTSHDCDTYEP